MKRLKLLFVPIIICLLPACFKHYKGRIQIDGSSTVYPITEAVLSCKHLLSKKQLKNKSAIESKFFIIKDYKNGKKKKGKELYDLNSYINDNQKN